MRQTIFVVPLGLLSGFVGSLLAQRSPSSPAVIEQRNVQVQPAAIVPPGWDLRFLSARVSQLEQKERNTDQPEAVAPQTLDDHQRERLEHYEKELALREQWLAAHAQEPIDTAWAEAQTEKVQKAFPAAAVECRSETCTVNTEFASALEALAHVQGGLQHMPEGCRGSVTIPTPPTSAGPYVLTTFVNNCR